MKKSKGILATTILTGALLLQGIIADSQVDSKSSAAIRPFVMVSPASTSYSFSR